MDDDDGRVKPATLYFEDFSNMKDDTGKNLHDGMSVWNLQFCGEAEEYVAFRHAFHHSLFSRTEFEGYKAVNWKLKSASVISLPSPDIVTFTGRDSRYGYKNAIELKCMCLPEFEHLKRNNGPRITMWFRGRMVHCTEWAGNYCLSRDGRYLAYVSNYEDGDQRSIIRL